MAHKYAENVTEKIMRLLKDGMGSGQIKTFYYGDPIILPQSRLTACLVNEVRTEIEVENTAQDLYRHFVTVTIVINKKTEFNKTPREQVGKRHLENIIGGIDLVTGKVADESVLGIIRQNFTLGSFAENQQVDVEYALGQRGTDVITEEVDLRFVIEDIVEVTRS